jgi:tRNA nucleotidyltransferase (CCA-adding enzyme)
MAVKLYKVGGYVRDLFLGVKSKDLDYAVECPSYQHMKDYISAKGTIFIEKPEYGTIRANINKEVADFVLCRKDGSYSDGRRPDSVQFGTIFDDLARRDFTMNAIAMDEDSEMIDPFEGQKDIEAKIIRCVGNTKERFSEDSLRILRAIRFSITKDMTLSGEIEDALLKDLDLVQKLKNVSKERIREELVKCFEFDTLKSLEMLEKFKEVRNMIFSNKIKLKPSMAN